MRRHRTHARFGPEARKWGLRRVRDVSVCREVCVSVRAVAVTSMRTKRNSLSVPATSTQVNITPPPPSPPQPAQPAQSLDASLYSFPATQRQEWRVLTWRITCLNSFSRRKVLCSGTEKHRRSEPRNRGEGCVDAVWTRVSKDLHSHVRFERGALCALCWGRYIDTTWTRSEREKKVNGVAVTSVSLSEETLAWTCGVNPGVTLCTATACELEERW